MTFFKILRLLNQINLLVDQLDYFELYLYAFETMDNAFTLSGTNRLLLAVIKFDVPLNDRSDGHDVAGTHDVRKKSLYNIGNNFEWLTHQLNESNLSISSIFKT